MAVKVGLVAVGMVLGVVCGAAFGVHGMDENGASDAEAAPVLEAPDAEVAPPAPEPGYSVWDRLAECESSGNWHANTGNGFFGGVQFDFGTWLRHGGGKYADRADHATRAQQIEIAQVALASQGWAAWPACSRKLGLR